MYGLVLIFFFSKLRPIALVVIDLELSIRDSKSNRIENALKPILRQLLTRWHEHFLSAGQLNEIMWALPRCWPTRVRILSASLRNWTELKMREFLCCFLATLIDHVPNKMAANATPALALTPTLAASSWVDMGPRQEQGQGQRHDNCDGFHLQGVVSIVLGKRASSSLVPNWC